MSSLFEEVVDRLAQDVIWTAEEIGDDEITEISRVVGTSSMTAQEAFKASVRLRLADARGREALAERIGRGPSRPHDGCEGGQVPTTRRAADPDG